MVDTNNSRIVHLFVSNMKDILLHAANNSQMETRRKLEKYLPLRVYLERSTGSPPNYGLPTTSE